jgi:hypothetical protein
LVDGCIGPLPQRGLDEAFGLAVDLGGIGFGEDVTDRSAAQEGGEGFLAVGRSVVAHEALHLDAQGGEVGERSM